MSHGLSDQTIATIHQVLQQFPQVHEATLFGSRAKGCARPGSDIDLALSGTGVDWRLIAQIGNAFDDTLLPYKFSLVALPGLGDADLLAHIQRVGQVFYVKGGALSEQLGPPSG